MTLAAPSVGHSPRYGALGSSELAKEVSYVQ